MIFEAFFACSFFGPNDGWTGHLHKAMSRHWVTLYNLQCLLRMITPCLHLTLNTRKMASCGVLSQGCRAGVQLTGDLRTTAAAEG